MSYHIQHIPVYHKISTGCKLHNSDSDLLGEIYGPAKNLLFKVIFSVNEPVKTNPKIQFLVL